MPPLGHEKFKPGSRTMEEIRLQAEFDELAIQIRDKIVEIDPNEVHDQEDTWAKSKVAVYQTEEQEGTDQYTRAWINRLVNPRPVNFESGHAEFEIWTDAVDSDKITDPVAGTHSVEHCIMYANGYVDLSDNYPNNSLSQNIETARAILDTLELIKVAELRLLEPTG